MKLEQEKKYIEKSDNFKETEFTIQNSPHAFKILSSGIYSNEIRSIIRELACNAWDSHIAANTTDIPFEVTLPTSLNKVFSVKDYGTGLSKEDVENLYTSYFKSTKSSSNDYTGAFGLGSKSPFSYTNSFTVTSIYNQKKYIFSAFISESGFPSISLLSEMDTDERNGLTVEFSVKHKDIWDFEYESFSALKYFPLAPKCNTIQFNNFEYPESGYSLEYGSTALTAVQGNVGYPIEGFSEYARMKIGITLFFDIGELSVTASREKLQYDSKTLESLQTKLNNIQDKIRKEVEEEILNNDSYLECYFKYREFIEKGISDDFLSSLDLKFDEKQIKREYCLGDSIKRAYYYKEEKWRSASTRLRSKNFVIFVADTKRYVKASIEKWLDTSEYEEAVLIYLEEEETFDDKHILTSAIPEYKPDRIKSNNLKTEKVINFSGALNRRTYQKLIDYSKTVYYLECNYNNIEKYSYDFCRKCREYFNLKNIDVISVPTSKLKTVKKKDNYVDFGEYIIELIKNEFDKSSDLLYYFFKRANPFISSIPKNENIENIKDEQLKNTLKLVAGIQSNTYYYIPLPKQLEGIYNEKIKKLNLLTDEKLLERYPLVRYITVILPDTFNDVVEYFNLKYVGDKK